MNRTVRGILVVASLVVALMAHRSMAQQGQISVNHNGVQQNYVLGPDGTYRVNDDGSLQQVDPASEPGLQGLSIPNMATPNSGGNNGGGPNSPGGNGQGGSMLNRPRGNGNGGGGSGQSPQQMQEQMQQKMRQAAEESLRKALGCSDQEWAALLAKIQKIEVLQSAVMPGSRLKAPTGGVDAPTSVAQLGARVQEFQKLVAIKDASEAELAQGLASVREARNEVKADLVQARKDLTDVVTQRQEAILFDRGILAD